MSVGRSNLPARTLSPLPHFLRILINPTQRIKRISDHGALRRVRREKIVRGIHHEYPVCPDDGRSVLLTLTPSGYAKVQAIEPEIVSVNNRLFGELSKSDFQELSRILGSLVDWFGQTVALLKALSSESEKSGKAISGISGK